MKFHTPMTVPASILVIREFLYEHEPSVLPRTRRKRLPFFPEPLSIAAIVRIAGAADDDRGAGAADADRGIGAATGEYVVGAAGTDFAPAISPEPTSTRAKGDPRLGTGDAERLIVAGGELPTLSGGECPTRSGGEFRAPAGGELRAALGDDPPMLNGGESPATLAIGETIFATGDPMRLIVLASAPGVIELAIDPGEVARVVGDVRRKMGDVLRRIGEVVRLTGGADNGFFAAVKDG